MLGYIETLLSGFAAVVLLLVVAAYLFLTWNFDYWAKRGVPHMEPKILFGNLKELLTAEMTSPEFAEHLYMKFPGKSFAGLYNVNKPAVLIKDPELLRSVLVKDFDHFVNRNFQPDENVDPLGAKNVFSMRGAKWRAMRAKLSPTFTSGKIKGMLPLLLSVAEELSEYLQKAASKKEPIDIKEVAAKYTTDVIAICIFGIRGNCLKDPNAEFREAGKRIFVSSYIGGLIQNALVYFPHLAKYLRLGFYPKETVDFFGSVIRSTMKHREDNNIVGKDMLQLMIQLKNEGRVDDDDDDDATDRAQPNGGLEKSNDTMKFDDDDILSQAMVFFEAGFETSSTTTSFACYELALNQKYQKLLQEDIDNVLQRHDGKVTYEAIQEMSYLDKVVSETLRKYPLLPMLDRVCDKPYTIPGSKVTIPKGMGIFIPVSGIHYDPKYYPIPDKFDPERFSDVNKRARPNYTYLPFGEGPRNCIGMRLGLLQVKAALIHIFRKFDVDTCEKTQIPMVFDPNTIMGVPRDGVFLEVKHRHIN